LLDRGETVIEIALDEGLVRTERERQSITEAELELKKGEPQALFDFAREISLQVPSQVTLTSKGERGYRLLAGEASRPVTRLAFALRSDMSSMEAIGGIGHVCLSALFDNLVMLVASGDAGALHQSRVCVRRLRAALSLFAPVLGWGDEKVIQAELKWLCDLLRETREFDVLVKSVLEPAAAANPDAPGFEPLIAAFRSRRDRAYAAITDDLRSRRLFELSLGLVARFVDLSRAGIHRPQGENRLETGITRFLAKHVRRRLSSFVKDSREIEKLEPTEQHRIRIRAKKLRYMIEPLGDLMPRKQYLEVVSSLREIQDALGLLNDGRINRGLVLAYAKDVLADTMSERYSLIAAGLAGASCIGHEAKALSTVTAARTRLDRISALRFG
jgi:inorganic triphosphatase YgiF